MRKESLDSIAETERPKFRSSYSAEYVIAPKHSVATLKTKHHAAFLQEDPEEAKARLTIKVSKATSKGTPIQARISEED